MKSQVFSSRLLLHTITAVIITLALTSCAEDHDEQFSSCSRLLRCGESVQNIGYPFWGGNRPQECGLQGFQLKCDEEEDGVFPTIDISNQTFRVLSINTSNHLLRIGHICPHGYKNTTLNVSLFRHSPDHDQMINLFYACPDYYYNYTSTRNRFVCNINGTESFGYYNYTSSVGLPNGQGCELNVTVPVLGTAIEEFRNNKSMTLQQLLNQGFNVEYMMDNVGCLACERSGGSCLSGMIMNTSSQPNCLYGHQMHHLVCTQNQGSELNVPRKIAIGIGAAAFGAIVMWIIFYMYHRRLKKRHSTSSMVSRDICSYPTSVADMEKAGNYYGVHVFNYDELEEATNNFDSNKELGDGGFGTVYKGKLRDGRVVAIKRLYENNYKRVEQFINEVEILALLRHKNLVTLYGCTSYRCRELLLVYEYIPNGTVADHLHGERAKPGLPSWTTRLNIAIETASALAYLHASDVIHRDVKTNNILLDDNFSVKVADFGLSRLFPANATHVSTAPQGTPGYVDPEYHQYYHLTDRSDVYSFGVVLIELISSKPAVDITRQRHEINLSNMAVNKIQSHALHELVDPYLGFESHSKVKIMITAVAKLAFQCLQLGREMRPSMQEVLEVLQGIQSNNSIIKADEMDIPADDVLLLKNDTLAYSPDSETVSRRSAIPYASG